MGKISVLTKEQKILLDLIASDNYIGENYYFTGGTALSEFYLQHRYSKDLDFFSVEKIDQELILGLMNQWAEQYGFTFKSRFAQVVYRFNLTFTSGENYKVDFGNYPYRQVEKPKKQYKQIKIDSLRDIASNKIFTINQRTDVKDFVDLYFLLQRRFTIWDLWYSAKEKFRQADFETMLLAQDLLKVEDFDSLPKMIKPLTLLQLKKFFRTEAKKLGEKVVE